MDTTVNTTITTKKTNMVIEVLLFVIHKSANANLLKYVEESAHYVDYISGLCQNDKNLSNTRKTLG